MGILVEDGHPAPCFSILHKVFDLLLLVIGVIIIIVSILYLVVIDTLTGLFSIVLAVGVVMSIVSVVSLFGSGYYEPNRSDRLICLQVNFIFLLIAAAASLICSLFCFITPEFVQRLFLKNWDAVQQFLETLPESTQSVGDLLTQIFTEKEKLRYIGIMLVALAVLLLADMSLSVLLMGVRVFVETLCRYGSVALSVLGGIIIAVVIYLFAKYNALVKTFSAVAVAAIVLGVLCILVGLAGIIFSCSCITTKVTIPLLIIALFYTGLAVLCIIGVALVSAFRDKIVTYATTQVVSACTQHSDIELALQDQNVVAEKEHCLNLQGDFGKFFCNSSRLIDPCKAPIEEEDATDPTTPTEAGTLTSAQLLTSLHTLHSSKPRRNLTFPPPYVSPVISNEDDDDEELDKCACKNLNDGTEIRFFVEVFQTTIDNIITDISSILCIMIAVLAAVIGVLTGSFFFYFFKARHENKLYNESVERRKNMGLLVDEEDDENYNIRDRGGGFANNAEQIQMQEQAELMAQQQLLERYAERKEQQRNLQAALKQSVADEKERKKQEKLQEQQELEQAMNESLANDWGTSTDYSQLQYNFSSQYPSY